MPGCWACGPCQEHRAPDLQNCALRAQVTSNGQKEFREGLDRLPVLPGVRLTYDPARGRVIPFRNLSGHRKTARVSHDALKKKSDCAKLFTANRIEVATLSAHALPTARKL